MPTEPCPICGHRLPREFLSTHLMRAHPDSAGGKEDAANSPPPSGAYQGDLASGLAAPDHLGSMPPPEAPGAVPAEEAAAAAPPPSEPAPSSEPASAPAPSEPAAPVEAASASAELPAADSPSSSPSSAPSVSSSPVAAAPTTKELHAWLGKHRHRTQRSLEAAQAWCDNLSPPRRAH